MPHLNVGAWRLKIGQRAIMVSVTDRYVPMPLKRVPEYQQMASTPVLAEDTIKWTQDAGMETE